MKKLDEAQMQRITEAVARAEAATAGELVVVLQERSDDYALHRAAVAFILSLGAEHAVHLLVVGVPLWGLMLGQAAVVALLYALFGSGPLLRLIVPGAVRTERVEEAARSAFVEHGVTETRDRSGVLVYLSHTEHRVVILADRGIDRRVEPGEWDRDVETLVASLRGGDPAGGLVTAIDRIGSLLAETFPPRPDDVNELPDAPRAG